MARYRFLDSSTAHVAEFETETEYLWWLLLPQNRDYVNDALGRAGRWQYELAALATQFLPEKGHFVDVGANCGAWALTIAKARPLAHVHAYEPQSMVFYQLAGNIFLNNLRNVRAHRIALGARPGQAALRLPDPRHLGSASLVLPGAELERVTITTLADIGVHPDVVKIDVEGYEKDVLEGGFQLLRSRHPIVFFTSREPRVHGGRARGLRAELFEYLEKLDYQTMVISGEDFIAFPAARETEVSKLVLATRESL